MINSRLGDAVSRRISSRHILPFLIFGTVCLLCTATSPAAEGPKSLKDDEYRQFEMLVDAIDQVERNYVKGIDRRELIEAAIRGVLEKLDPYSDYIGPQEVEEFRAGVDNEFAGIGVQVEMEGGRLRVISPIAGTPAQTAGVCAGDFIVEVDDQPMKGLSLDDAVRRLKGRVGTPVALTVLSPSTGERRKINITRANIVLQTVRGYKRDEDGSWEYVVYPKTGLAYVHISAFCRNTADELRKVLESLHESGMRGLILDLRFNPGGLLDSSIEVADLFVSEGRIVSTSGRNHRSQTWDATGKGTFSDFPIAVLVNRYSASGSEIVAACLQDHNRAVIIGERTWGKGSVQNVIELEEGNSVLKLTTAAYQRPSGKNIHRFPDSTEEDDWGVMPNEGYAIEHDNADVARLYLQQHRRDSVPEKQGGRRRRQTSSLGFQNDEAFQMAVEYLRKKTGATPQGT